MVYIFLVCMTLWKISARVVGYEKDITLSRLLGYRRWWKTFLQTNCSWPLKIHSASPQTTFIWYVSIPRRNLKSDGWQGNRIRSISQICYSSQLQNKIFPREVSNLDQTKNCDHRPVDATHPATPINQRNEAVTFQQDQGTREYTCSVSPVFLPTLHTLPTSPLPKAEGANIYN